MKKVYVTNIQYDFDEGEEVELSKEITFNFEQLEMLGYEPDDDLDEAICDYLSYITGFCILTFDFEIKEDK